jgi:hypothetical protein
MKKPSAFEITLMIAAFLLLGWFLAGLPGL